MKPRAMAKLSKFRVEFECENAAFADDRTGEVARILRNIADQVEREGLSRTVGNGRGIIDANGNTVGRWFYSAGEG